MSSIAIALYDTHGPDTSPTGRTPPPSRSHLVRDRHNAFSLSALHSRGFQNKINACVCVCVCVVVVAQLISRHHASSCLYSSMASSPSDATATARPGLSYCPSDTQGRPPPPLVHSFIVRSTCGKAEMFDVHARARGVYIRLQTFFWLQEEKICVESRLSHPLGYEKLFCN